MYVSYSIDNRIDESYHQLCWTLLLELQDLGTREQHKLKANQIEKMEGENNKGKAHTPC